MIGLLSLPGLGRLKLSFAHPENAVEGVYNFQSAFGLANEDYILYL